ncbi:hypothetical protein BROOK1789C_1863 [Bathymodiolus brooksi thiotrophic gill symbiont]|nr:hypothetical protein BROOK1789B_16 [Bathymodiolus brooksi thiotrophic gill symbiont]CAB9544665.1 hypothetical protein BROOK1789C_1863 [Bathymodiolus brooksi thiotrophic gill symbiont]SHE20914.1 hypothetical protein BBROOKSOX_867 [Bathymodiolus brooksi thiotrophic gill symbiont]
MINMKSMGVLYSSSTKKNALHKKQIKNLILIKINEVFNAVFSLSSFIYSALGDKPRLG